MFLSQHYISLFSVTKDVYKITKLILGYVKSGENNKKIVTVKNAVNFYALLSCILCCIQSFPYIIPKSLIKVTKPTTSVDRKSLIQTLQIRL